MVRSRTDVASGSAAGRRREPCDEGYGGADTVGKRSDKWLSALHRGGAQSKPERGVLGEAESGRNNSQLTLRSTVLCIPYTSIAVA